MSYLYFYQSVPGRTALCFLATLPAVSLAAQPMPVQDVFPQSSASTVYNGSQYLWASSAATGNERWKSDLAGSAFGLVKEFVPGPGGTGSGSCSCSTGCFVWKPTACATAATARPPAPPPSATWAAFLSGRSCSTALCTS